MTDDRMSGLALIASSVAGIITMSLHPTGHDLFVPGQLDSVIRVLVAVHALALVSLPVCFLGALGLSRRLAAADRLSIAALVVYGFGLAAITSAAAFGGLVAPRLAREIVEAAPPASEAWRILFRYTGQLNQAFAQVFVAASSIAILLWSAAILRSRALAPGLGVYGCVLGPVTLLALLSGRLTMGVHGFGLVVLVQAVWYVSAGAMLCRPRNA